MIHTLSIQFLTLTLGIATWSLVRGVRHGLRGNHKRGFASASAGLLIFSLDILSAIQWGAVAPS